MAIALDRSPRRWRIGPIPRTARRRRRSGGGCAAHGSVRRRRRARGRARATCLGAGQVYSRWTAQDWLLARSRSVLDYVQDPSTFIFHITSPIGELHRPARARAAAGFFVETPWFVTLGGLVAARVRPQRPAAWRHAALMLAADRRHRRVGGRRWTRCPRCSSRRRWRSSSASCSASGRPRAGRSSRILRPVNDVLQTLPQLVYIIPFVYLMPVSFVPGDRRGALCVPGRVRLVERGIRDVAPTRSRRPARSARHGVQVLLKVKIPLARDAIMLGVNQGIIMVLAVVVIGGLVGSAGSATRSSRACNGTRSGSGVVASLAILALGIALDRVTRERGPQDRREGAEERHAHKEGRMRKRSRGRWLVAALVGGGAAARSSSVGPARDEGRTAARSRSTSRRGRARPPTRTSPSTCSRRLGCKVNITKIAEIPVYQAMADGKVDAVLEDWSTSTQSTSSTSQAEDGLDLEGSTASSATSAGSSRRT